MLGAGLPLLSNQDRYTSHKILAWTAEENRYSIAYWLKHSSRKCSTLAPTFIFKYFADLRTVSSGESGITPLRVLHPQACSHLPEETSKNDSPSYLFFLSALALTNLSGTFVTCSCEVSHWLLLLIELAKTEFSIFLKLIKIKHFKILMHLKYFYSFFFCSMLQAPPLLPSPVKFACP